MWCDAAVHVHLTHCTKHQNKASNSFILRDSSVHNAYALSFVDDDRSIKHFLVELKDEGWYACTCLMLYRSQQYENMRALA
jgi:hypothetical protein